MIRVADDMRIWRATWKVSQEEAASIVGVSLKTWQRWENEHSRPNEDHYNTIRWVIARPPYPDRETRDWLAAP
jgi:DNA-binding transcriptional regulator YiaG